MSEFLYQLNDWDCDNDLILKRDAVKFNEFMELYEQTGIEFYRTEALKYAEDLAKTLNHKDFLAGEMDNWARLKQ